MRKILWASYWVLQSSFSFGNEISQTWSMEDHTYNLKQESYDPDKVKAYHGICTAFQKVDSTIVRHLPEKEFDEFRENILNIRASWLERGDASLLLLYKNNEMIGGTYYFTEENGRVVRLSCAGYKLGLDKEELVIAQMHTLSVLSSKNYFPHGEKLIATLAQTSGYIPLLEKFGFVKSDYPVEQGVPKEHYISFEKPMT